MTAQIQDVSETALMVAMWRALENQNPKPLFRDPLAEKLAGLRGREIVSSAPRMRAKMGAWMMAIRTRLIDDMIQQAIAGGVDVVLNLGAGLDTRPYRMSLPSSLLWLEVDIPKIIDLKESQLAREKPVCRLERLRCDLSDARARRELFATVAARGKQILVLTEGVIVYLKNEDVGTLADDLRKYESFRLWITDYFSPFVMRYRNRRLSQSGMENAPFLFEPDDYYGFFDTHGWRSKEIHYIGDAARKLKRPPPLLLRLGAVLRAPFMGAQGRQEMRESMAYVLFEPNK